VTSVADVTIDSGTTGGIPRRTLLAVATAAAVPAVAVAQVRARPGPTAEAGELAVSSAAVAGFHDRHQPGIVSPPLPYLVMAGFDLLTPHRDDVGRLLRTWSTLGARFTSAERTVTVGFGPSMFEGPLGLADRRPGALNNLPAFAGEAIDETASHGDLCVQVCAATPAAAAGAVRALAAAGHPLAGLRWRQVGYRDQDGTSDPRGPLGFHDGTVNLDIADPATTAQQLWVSDGPDWLHNGSYLVVRRIRLVVDTWDRTGLGVQESIVGRTLTDNRRLGVGHAQLARPEQNGGATMLRRSYGYDAGVDVNGLQDTGLIFIAFQRDPSRQFVPVQHRLASDDAGLNNFSQHVASGVFACPPGCAEGSWLGAGLLT
jgi:deferrochelatase/peroxidase EfeB